MDNQRLFLWVGLLFLLWMNYDAWQRDYAPKPLPASAQTAAATSASGAPASALGGSLPSVGGAATGAATPAVAGAPATGAATPAPAAATPSAFASAAPAAAPTVHVRTDVLDLTLSTVGGELQRATLPRYPVKKDEPNTPVTLLNVGGNDTTFLFQSGLTAGAANEPNHLARFTAAANEYTLASGQNDVEVPLTWTNGEGVTVTKTYTFTRGSYAVQIRYDVQNASNAPFRASQYAQILRHWQHPERSMWNPETYSFKGPAIWDGNKYRKLDVENDEDTKLSIAVKDGWLAALQHHFAVAFVPPRGEPQTYSMNVKDKDFLLRAVGPMKEVAPGTAGQFKETVWIGPKLQAPLADIHPELPRVTDYGNILFVIAKPLFWLLQKVHNLIGNWGWAIIVVTLLLKLLFYKLAETSGRSMAKMRNLQPRMKDIQERYKDDREALGRAMMELYKREKINPVAGCLPILIQIPVFMGFYWVLLESVEMRQAPWMLWINDLSVRDPFFVLPMINGLAMYGQFKLNPAPPDPVQAKVFAFMPLVMTAMMAFFPSGLVLYWITNTGLSIAQQWRINKVVEAEAKAAKR
jgi:YidC/Oxa1 family membrane protein insertase